MPSKTILNDKGRMEWKKDSDGAFGADPCDGVWFYLATHYCAGRWEWRGHIHGVRVTSDGSYITERRTMYACERWIAKYVAPVVSGAQSVAHDAT